MNNAERQLAVVTGASSGIGFELAKVFAEEGYDLIVAAEDEELQPAASELNQVGRGVEAMRVDLSRAEGVGELYERVTANGRPVDALCLNAGIGAGGDFARETALAKELRLIDLNVRSTVHLAKLVLADMVDRDEGRVLFTSSVASTRPPPRDLPAEIDLGRHRDFEGRRTGQWIRRGFLTLLFVFIVAALANVFGQAAATDTASGAAGSLSVKAPSRVRGGLAYQGDFVIHAKEALAAPTLVLARG